MSATASERAARLIVLGLVGGLLMALAGAWWIGRDQSIEVRGRMAETGGWTPANLSAAVGQTLRLRLASDDVVHGFAVGQRAEPAVDVLPGKMTEVSLTFDQPGTYTFYCTRWCGVNHWRMRGTIEVTGPGPAPSDAGPPLYVRLGLDIDAPHPADVVPERRPSAARGERLSAQLPPAFLAADYYRSRSPAQAWHDLRAELPGASDAEVWDLVAFVWRANTTAARLADARALYAANCAACHGETGAGDGVMGAAVASQAHAVGAGQHAQAPVAFTDAASALGASPALWQGKLIRGGMGTGMPYWGPIFTESQTWDLVAYLWTFQFDLEDLP